jgi:hypothetical protein
MFDYAKLRGKIREVFNTEGAFANAMGSSKVTVSAKLNGRVDFTQNEIAKAADLLKISPDQIPEYFFTK